MNQAFPSTLSFLREYRVTADDQSNLAVRNATFFVDQSLTPAALLENMTSPAAALGRDDVSGDYVTALLKAVAMVTIIVMALLGNTLVIVSVYRFERLRIIANSFIVSMAMADLLVACLVMSFNASQEILGYWAFGEVVCDLFNANDVLFSTASLLHLCCISMDRYIAVTDPFRYESKMTRRRVAVMLCCVWSASALLSHAPIHAGWYRDHRYNTSVYVVGDDPLPHCHFEVNQVYGIVSSFISFWSPVLVMIFTYVKIFREARKQERTIRALTHQQMVAERRGGGGAAATTAAPAANSPGSAVSARRFASTAGGGPPPSSSGALHVGTITVSKTNGNGGGRTSDSLTVSMSNGVAASEGIKLVVAEEGVGGYSEICAQASRGGDVVVKEGCSFSGSPHRSSSFVPGGGGGGGAASARQSSEASSSSHGLTGQHRRMMQRENKAARTLGIIMGAFLFCWLPFFTWYLTTSICQARCETPPVLIAILFWIGYLNSALNPVIYAFFNRDFREAFKRLLRLRRIQSLLGGAKERAACCRGAGGGAATTGGASSPLRGGGVGGGCGGGGVDCSGRSGGGTDWSSSRESSSRRWRVRSAVEIPGGDVMGNGCYRRCCGCYCWGRGGIGGGGGGRNAKSTMTSSRRTEMTEMQYVPIASL